MRGWTSSRSVALCAGVLAFGAAAAAQTAGKDPPLAGPAAKPADMGPLSKPAPPLPQMYLDHKLFSVDKWWQYQGADVGKPRARNMEYAVVQTGTATFSGNMPVPQGAFVKYTARDMGTPADAKKYVHTMAGRLRAAKYAPLTKRPIKAPGSTEAIEVVQDLVTPGKGVTEHARTAMLQYGRYVVTVEQRSNMKAFGPKPGTGVRRWMSEPVYETVLAAVQTRWTNYKTIVPAPTK